LLVYALPLLAWVLAPPVPKPRPVRIPVTEP
jgi:hypothetical protein